MRLGQPAGRGEALRGSDRRTKLKAKVSKHQAMSYEPDAGGRCARAAGGGPSRTHVPRSGIPTTTPVESFVQTLKHEEAYPHDHTTLRDAIQRLPSFVEEVHSHRRRLGYGPPQEYAALPA